VSGPNRRSILTQLGLLGLVGVGLFAARDRLVWPPPKVRLQHGHTSGWMPFSEPGGMIELPAFVVGHAIQLVVDSGAQYSAIDAELALRLGLPQASPIPLLAFGVSGKPSVTRSVKLDLDMGAMTLTGLRAAELDLHALSRLTRRPFSMLIGRDLLRTVVAEIDFPASRIAFHRPETWRPRPDDRAVTARNKSGALMAEVQVEQAPPLDVMVDTGATAALALSDAAASAAGLLAAGRTVSTGRSITVGGLSQDRVVRAAHVRFAGQMVPDAEVQIYTPSARSAIPQGLLGLGILKRFRVTLDHGGGRMFIAGPYPTLERRRRSVRITPTPGLVEE
jgi:predicted aspartyl protease